jgi:stress response protein SCP2
MKQLQQGGNTVIETQRLNAQLSWAPCEPHGLECDASAFLLGADGKVRSDSDFVFYGAVASVCGGVSLKTSEGATTFTVDFGRLAADVEKVALTVSLPAESDWSKASQLTVALEGIAEYVVDVGAQVLSSIIVCELYRRGDAWKVRAVGQGFSGGLGTMAQHFGVEVDDDGEEELPVSPTGSVSAAPVKRAPRLGRKSKPQERPLTILLNSHFNVRQQLAAAFGRRAVRFVLFQPGQDGTSTVTTTRYAGDTVVERISPGLNGNAYATRLLQVAHRHRVDVALIGRRMMTVATALQSCGPTRTRFVCAASAGMLQRIDNKALTYKHLAGSGVPLPRYVAAWTMDSFESAVAMLGGSGLAYKPMQSIFGRGFHVLVEHPSHKHPSPRQTAEPAQDYDRSLPEAMADFAAQGYAPQIVMAELPGVERSIDCLAVNGKLACAIVRKKLSARYQLIERNEQLVWYVRKIAAKFSLDGLFNVQFRDGADGRPYLLEINPRMSGGIPYTFATGVNLPYWAILIALGRAQPPSGAGTAHRRRRRHVAVADGGYFAMTLD